MRIFITGSTGFVGRVLISELLLQGFSVAAGVRSISDSFPVEVKQVEIRDLSQISDHADFLNSVDVVIHLAARAHILNDKSSDPSSEYRSINVTGTRRLALMAAKAGIKRFIFLSSVKVNGEQTFNNAFNEKAKPDPEDAYGISKLEAEEVIKEVCCSSNMEYVILRSPLVYGPKVKANFLKLMRIVDYGLPLPLDSIKNRRSLIYIGNLVDAIIKCIEHPSAANKTYMLSDGEDLSTPELIQRLSSAMGKKNRLFNFPVSLLKMAAAVAGRSAEVDRLIGNLTIDSSKIRNELGWTPPYSVSEGLRLTAQWYKNEKSF